MGIEWRSHLYSDGQNTSFMQKTLFYNTIISKIKKKSVNCSVAEKKNMSQVQEISLIFPPHTYIRVYTVM